MHEIAAALVAARMLQSSSDRAACDWLNRSSATLELVGPQADQPLNARPAEGQRSERFV